MFVCVCGTLETPQTPAVTDTTTEPAVQFQCRVTASRRRGP